MSRIDSRLREMRHREHMASHLKCYACEAPATSEEHAPPRCFFPEARDLPSDTPSWRTNLVKVPSCQVHNQDKSSDDEYAACCIAMNAEGSDIALTLFQGTRLRAMLRNEERLGKRIFSTARPAQDTEGRDTLAISYEVNRIFRVVEQTARALYFHETGHRWPDTCAVVCPRLYGDTHGHPEYADILSRLQRLTEGFDELRRRQIVPGAALGAHPEVFWYQLIEHQQGAPLMRMMFYSTFEFFAATHDPAGPTP